MRFPRPIQNLIDTFAQLPTVGPKTAERFAFYLLKQDKSTAEKLAQAILSLKEQTTICTSCFSFAETNPCPICSDPKRTKEQLCVVSDFRDRSSVEATKEYRGGYFVLNGELSHLDGIGPEQLHIRELIKRIKHDQVTELILALNPTIEGETTSLYLKKLLAPLKIKITRLARGLPMGADLEYVDELTLSNALKYRNEL